MNNRKDKNNEKNVKPQQHEQITIILPCRKYAVLSFKKGPDCKKNFKNLEDLKELA